SSYLFIAPVITDLGLIRLIAEQFSREQEGNFTFSLESVKTLKSLMDSSAGRSLRLAKTSSVAVCDNPALPMEFQPLCHQPGAGMAFFRLASVDHDICEICAFAACTGC
uniref:Guanylate cyclase activator 2B n=1 Tax=Lepisosteus oculatus TaxID=7918 RepID=W5M6R4_LEPOC